MAIDKRAAALKAIGSDYAELATLMAIRDERVTAWLDRLVDALHRNSKHDAQRFLAQARSEARSPRVRLKEVA